MPEIIQVKNLTKIFKKQKKREGIIGGLKDLVQRNYSDFKAVDNIGLSINEGELLGYIGPNGAGKSTSIKMLTGILKSTSGTMNVLGYDPFRDRKTYTCSIGVVFGQRTQLWWDIAVIESFKLLAKIYRVNDADYKKRLDILCDVLDLRDLLNTPVRKLSLGQRMKCDLAASLLHQPKILFLDEPTIGLDAIAKDSIRGFLKYINKEFKTTILLTTHDLKEIEELCSRILILDKGIIVYDGSISKIKSLPGLKRSLVVDFSTEIAADKLNSLFHEKLIYEMQGARRAICQYDHQELPTADLLKDILANFNVSDVILSEPNIEDVIKKIYTDGL